MYCEIVLLLLNTHMFCVYLIVEGQLMDGNKLFYFTLCLKGKLMHVWWKIGYTFPELLIALCLNICLHSHVHLCICSSSDLPDFSLKPFGGTGILICGASSRIMLDKPQPHCNCSSWEKAGKGWIKANPGCVLLIPVLWSPGRWPRHIFSAGSSVTVQYHMCHLNTKPL